MRYNRRRLPRRRFKRTFRRRKRYTYRRRTKRRFRRVGNIRPGRFQRVNVKLISGIHTLNRPGTANDKYTIESKKWRLNEFPEFNDFKDRWDEYKINFVKRSFWRANAPNPRGGDNTANLHAQRSIFFAYYDGDGGDAPASYSAFLAHGTGIRKFDKPKWTVALRPKASVDGGTFSRYGYINMLKAPETDWCGAMFMWFQSAGIGDERILYQDTAYVSLRGKISYT